MKKGVLMAVFALGFLCLSQTELKAQYYYTYDGDQFSIQLMSDANDWYIVDIAYSDGGEWWGWQIDAITDYEETESGGFRYHCTDGAGVPFTIDYYRDWDYIIVFNENTGDQWTLTRR